MHIQNTLNILTLGIKDRHSVLFLYPIDFQLSHWRSLKVQEPVLIEKKIPTEQKHDFTTYFMSDERSAGLWSGIF